MSAVAPARAPQTRQSRVQLPECPQEAARFFVRHFAQWSGLALADVSRAVLACRHYWATLEHFLDFRNDPGMPAAALAKLERRLARERDKAIRRLEPIIEAGLVAREGKRMMPHGRRATPAHQVSADWLAWETIELCMATLGVEAHGLSVCDTCTAVFRARRGRSAQHCAACAKRVKTPLPARHARPRRTSELVARAAGSRA
jgi:hypothetical protein